MKWLKIGGVIFGALIVTALGIDAADTLTGSRSTLLGQLISSDAVLVCPKDMVEVQTASSFKCVDIYEASAGNKCPHQNPINEQETKENIESSECKTTSVSNVDAWRFITREQAQTVCMQAGKRLPNSDEWYVISVGTPDDTQKCNVLSNGVQKTAANSNCTSAVGVYDTIGNVWEWVSDDIINGQFQGRELPSSGYVTQVDSHGVATVTNSAHGSNLFYQDYLWSSKEGAYGMLRGGFYGSKSDAGVYAVHAQTLPTSAGTAIGFRCVK